MPNAININTTNQESGLDKILKGLTVAKDVVGIGAAIPTVVKELTGPPKGTPTQLDLVKAGFRSAPSSPMASGPQMTEAAVNSGMAQGPPAPPGLVQGPVPRFSKLKPAEITYVNDKGDETKGQFVDTKTENQMREFEEKLRHNWTQNPTTKRSLEIGDAWSRLQETISHPGKLGADDMATIFSFMKLVDPGSTVREGEFHTAEGAGGSANTIANFFNKLTKGQRLSPELRNDFDMAANNLVHGQKFQQDLVDDQYKKLSDEEGFRHDLVITPIFKRLDEKLAGQKTQSKKTTPSEKTAPSTPQIPDDRRAAAMKWLDANPDNPDAAAVRVRLGL